LKKEIILDDLCDELRPYVHVEPDGSWRLRPLQNLPKQEGHLKPQPPLTGYFYDRDIELEYIRHNQEWARGEQLHPKFLFAYLILATSCELKCKGCYQGMDRKMPEVVHWKKSWLYDRLDEILDYLISRGGKSIAYAGQGELMTDPDAFELIERVRMKGLHFVMFSNGQELANKEKVRRIDELGVTLILSLKSTVENEHDSYVRNAGAFRRCINALAHSVGGNFRQEKRLAIDLPVTKKSFNCVSDFVKIARQLEFVPLPEMYVVVGLPEEEIQDALTFQETDAFFQEISNVDKLCGFESKLEVGQRIIGRPPCQRPWFTFTIDTAGQIITCPANSNRIGTLVTNTIATVIESDFTVDHFKKINICCCSTYVTQGNVKIGILPKELQLLI
jgi:MoaA/NifB/PqqE/SkfB family radical SAM enzyme